MNYRWHLLSFYQILLLVILSLMLCSVFQFVTPDSSNQTTTFIITPNYELFSIKNEILILFNAYYESSTRHNYIKSSLKRCKNINFTIREHLNKIHKSDFDVVFLENDKYSVKETTNNLLKHPYIKKAILHKKILQSLKVNNEEEQNEFLSHDANRHLLRYTGTIGHITNIIQAPKLWSAGFRGQNVKVAIFDTGLSARHTHFKTNSIIERSDWTNENHLDDNVGHGTFVAGIISSSSSACPGLSPDAKLYVYRVFTSRQVSYTSWFLDAFNHAITRKVDILNLSIGGPDFNDAPFVDKVHELIANGVSMISAIGNDGPLYGTLNNPADMADVIGVGGIDEKKNIAHFSSRGMTTWELPTGYGRVKPDVVTLGSNVRSSALGHGCRSLSGTSVASPVVAGVVALLLSVSPKASPMIIKQALMETAKRIPNANMFEQGAGQIDAIQAANYLKNYIPHIYLHPPYVDLTECPYMWPYCTQPIFFGSQPVIVNVTILSGFGVMGFINSTPIWYPYIPHNGHMLNIEISYSSVIWPYSGYVSVSLYASKAAENFDGVVHGHIELIIWTDNGANHSNVTLPIRAKIIVPPPRERRIIWSQWHQIRYPSAYVPRDNLKMKNDPLDWNADHLHTNFKDFYQQIRSAGYYVDILRTPLTCINSSQYSTILLVDSEEEFWPEEIERLRELIKEGLSILILGDWYNTTVMKTVKFFDENTQQWWLPVTGGANIPALNDLLKPYDILLSDRVLEGKFKLLNHDMYFASGTTISRFPENGLLLTVDDLNDQGHEIILASKNLHKLKKQAIGGLFQSNDKGGGGRIAIYGDSNCIDSSKMQIDCFWFILNLLDYTSGGILSDSLAESFTKASEFHFNTEDFLMPQRLNENRLHIYSKVIELPFVYRNIMLCPTTSFVASYPLNVTAEGNFYRRTKLLSLPLQIEKIFPKTPDFDVTSSTPLPKYLLICTISFTFIALIVLLKCFFTRKFRRVSHRTRTANRVIFRQRSGIFA